MGPKDIVANVNFFMYVPVGENGEMDMGPSISKPGDFVDLRAETDVLAVISNCPQVNNPVNDYNPTPIRILVFTPDTPRTLPDPQDNIAESLLERNVIDLQKPGCDLTAAQVGVAIQGRSVIGSRGMIERAVTVRKWWSSQLDHHIGSSAVFIRCRSLVELASLGWMFCRQDWSFPLR